MRTEGWPACSHCHSIPVTWVFVTDAPLPFSELTSAWFASAFSEPTPAQVQGWQAISRGDHTLVLAPTGSGKTLAAFLWAIDRLVTSPSPPENKRLRVLYVSPLKSLTYDVERNLRAPLAGIALEAERRGVTVAPLRVATRTGDTPQSERRDIVRHPPDVLITTPESLYLMLTSAASEVLTSVEAVIVDEIHVMAATKRGAHLALSLERLEQVIRRAHPERVGRPQRIGLSATQRPLDEIARFLGGREQHDDGSWRERPVTIVDAGVRKQLDLRVVVPVEDMGELGRVSGGEEMLVSGPAAGNPEARASIWPAIHPRLLDLIRTHTSTLIFVNSRRLAERLASRLNELAAEQDGFEGDGPVPELVRSHHGSIAREQRLEIEDALKAGKLPALVATSSLELGIDMGAIDLVVQVEAPTSVASGLQRIGRAGHQVGAPSKGAIFPKFRGDLVVAAVASQRMQAGLIEQTRVPRNPLDVLAQQIVAMVAAAPESAPVTVDDVTQMAAGTYSFSELRDEALHGVLDMLAGKYPSDEFAELRPRIVWDRVTGALTPRAGARMLATTSGGTIPDRGLFGVFTPEGARVGELDEEMVYESRVGEAFILGATTWKIVEITRDRVVVVPAPGEIGKMPFWHGDALGRPYELGEAVGAFLRTLDETNDAELEATAGLDQLAVANLRQYVQEERDATGGVLPTDRQIVVERFRDELGDWRVCVLSPFGARVHAPWALAVESKIREQLGVEVQAIWNDDGIVLRLPEADELPSVDSVLLDPDEVDELVVDQVGSSAIFAARFRENAARSLLLPRRRPGSRTPLWQMRQRASDLLGVASHYGEFPILLETYRECLSDVFDLPALSDLMKRVRSRSVRVTAVDTDAPSPFASSLVFSYVANFLYEGDAPLAERRAQALTLDRRMLAELLGDEELRDLIDVDVLEQLASELQALDERKMATSVDTAHDLLRRLGDLTIDELRARCTDSFDETLLQQRRAIVVRVAGNNRLIPVEDAGRYRDGLGVALPVGVPEAFLAPVEDAWKQIVRRYARTHVPFHAAEIASRFGLSAAQVTDTLTLLAAEGRVVHGEFRPGGVEREWCDVDVLRVLRQRSLAALRKEIEPTDVSALIRFLPSWQGVDADARGIERCHEVIGRLQGVALPASVLERDILSRRIRDYSPRLLDELIAAGELMWVGAGPLGRNDGRVRLFLRGEPQLLLSCWPIMGMVRPEGHEHDRLRMLLANKGACFFRELGGVSDRETLEALWDLVWAGEVTNDSFAPVRAQTVAKTGAGVQRRRRPSHITALGPPIAQGRWSLVSVGFGEMADRSTSSSADATTPSGAIADRSRVSAAALTNAAMVLLERHGVLTREAVRGEGVPGGFAAIYPILKAMEERGRIRRGYFVTGRGGAQFALPGAVDRLRAFREGVPSGTDRVCLLAATDPANPFGVSLPWPEKGLQRVPGAFVILVDGELALYLEKGGKGIQALLPFDGSWEREACTAMLSLLHGTFSRLVLAKVPDELVPLLRELDFVPTPRGLTRYAR